VVEQGVTYSVFIAGQLKAEYERRVSLDARGLAVITSSGAFTTFVFALLVVLRGKDFVPTSAGKVAISFSLLLFVVSGVVGLYAAQLLGYHVIDLAAMKAMTKTRWIDDEVDARNACAVANLKSIKTLREGNNKKAGRIVVAGALQLAAVGALGVAIVLEVTLS